MVLQVKNPLKKELRLKELLNVLNKNYEMKYFKLFLMWVGYLVLTSMFGEYVVSREVNGFLQLLSFVGMVGLLMYIGNETIKILIKTKKEEK
jgi:hypothetical protein